MYVCVNSLGDGDNVPLLDSKFPDVGGKGRGYILQTTPSGTDEWPALRKMSIWQTAAALQRVNSQLKRVYNICIFIVDIISLLHLYSIFLTHVDILYPCMIVFITTGVYDSSIEYANRNECDC